MTIEADKLKWEGRATANLLKPTAKEVWPLLEDFYNIHKLFPSLDTCYKVDGVEGVVRYCSFSVPPSEDGDDNRGALKWCHEKLIEIDPIGKWLSYEITDNNLGLKAYKATLKVNGGDDLSGCQIEWSFVADPVEGLDYADFCANFDRTLQGIVKNIEKIFELST